MNHPQNKVTPRSNTGSVHETLIEDAQKVRIEDLPLDKKLEELRKYNPIDYYDQGRYIDAQDSVNSWCLGQITQSDNRNLQIHFDGWSNRWDVWQKVTSYKIAPFRKNSRGYTGQNKIALRQNHVFKLDDVHTHKQRVERLIESDLNGVGAFHTTQYLRGDLYIYVDFLLQHSPYTDEEIDAINDFMYCVIRLIVTWLKKLPKLLHLQSQIKVNPDLFLIDENIAIIQSGYELMDILKKLFGCCHRCIKFYIENDKNPIQFENPVTKSYAGIDFEIRRKSPDDLTDVEDIREQIMNRKGIEYGQFMNFINYFAELGGFDAIIDYLKVGSETSEDKIPLDIITMMTSPFKNCNEIFSPTFAQKFVFNVRDILISRIRNISEKELKEIDKEIIGRVLNDLKEFLTLFLNEEETAEIVETNQLLVALRFLKSTYLEKRLKGISEIKFMIERLDMAQKQAQIQILQQQQRFANKMYFDNEMNQLKNFRSPKWLTQEKMRDWLLNEKILEIVLGENTHLEIVKRSSCILKFLAKLDSLPLDSVDLIWKSQLGKHEEMVRVVYQMIQELVPFTQHKYIDMFYQKIQQVPTSQYDDKFLEFLKDFTMKSLESYYDTKHNEDSINESNTIAYEDYISLREKQALQRIGEIVNNQQINQLGDEKHYGLPIFWELIQDRATSVSSDQMQIAIKSINDILRQQFSHPIRINYLVKSVDNLVKGESVVQSIEILQNIVDQFPISQFNENDVTQKTVIVQLNKQLQLVNKIIQNIKNYHLQVKEKLKTLQASKKILPEDISTYIFVGKHAHDNILNQLLKFLESLIIESNLDVTIGPENINTLWEIFVQQPNFSSDQNLFLKWINLQRQHDQFIFNDEERKYLFTKILCNPTYVNKMSYGQVKCFQKYFKIINSQEENMEIQRKRMRVINHDKLIGLDTLWRMAVESENEKSKEESMDLLVELHLKFDQSLSIPEQHKVWLGFINKCVKNLDSADDNLVANTIQLLSRFIDKYEGKRPLKPDVIQPQYQNFTPCTVTVQNRVDSTRKQVQIGYFQTMGHLRQKIADAFDLQINEFTMSLRNSFVDQDEDDNKLVKEFGVIQSVFISKNASYNADNHPKNIIASNQANYETLFFLLSKDNPQLVETAWDLLQKLPVNVKLSQEIKELSGLGENSKNWERLLDPKSTNKLLYSLRIINNLHSNKKDPKCQQWKYKFVSLGGFTHLLKTFINLEIKQIDTNLILKCVEHLIFILHDFIVNDRELVKLVMDNKESVILKSINLIDLIAEFFLVNEKKRGYSLEDLNKRLLQNKQKKNKYKQYMMGGKGQGNLQQNSQNEEEDDKESQEYTQYQQLQKQFVEDCQIISSLFKFMFLTVFNNDPSASTIVVKYKNLENLIAKTTIQNENYLVRTEVIKKFKEIMGLRQNLQDSKLLQDILIIMLFKIQDLTQNHELRCTNFFEGLMHIIDNQAPQEINTLEIPCKDLIFKLASFIQEREIREKNTQDTDFLLIGKMKILKVLLQKFPQYKQQVGKFLTGYLLHQCLFEVPQGGSSKNQTKLASPKCKNFNTRKFAIQLLSVLCRDCLPNLECVLQYMQQFNQNPSWRTNKDHDWQISLMDSEKSSTGYVGIKNLGCICYMNSLFQQLFMVSSFRNDLLSVKEQNGDKVEKEDNMLYQLQLLFAGLLKSEKQYVNPKGFCHAFKDWDGNPTNVMEQMDVEEFFNMIMDRIETAIKGSPYQHTIQQHFGGKFASEMICKGCPHRYENSEPFLSISIPVKNKKSILEGLGAFIQGDMLEGDNAYMCEKCDKKVDALKRTCVKKLPKHLIVALRRFEFDYDKMIRVKINDYCEFPMEFSMEPYTQEGLARREKFQKMKEERGEDDSNEQQIEMDPLRYPPEYYDYQLSGIVVHSGTADSGHYYSFIKDRDHPESGKWYELNDHIVRDFDPVDIPQECYGGEDTFQGYNMVQIKSMKWRNAYLLFYEKKVQTEMNSDDEKELDKTHSSAKEDVEMKTDSQELSTLAEIEEKIAYENQKYWQNRFLFGNEYHEFVYDVALNWNTSQIIPKNFLTKNNDFHLVNLPMPKEYERDINILEPPDLKYPIDQVEADKYEERVFQFAAGFYITILQRAQNKLYIPQMVNLLKSYINKNSNCARWLISQFCNHKIIEETLLQCGQKEMRKFIIGLLYCAMLKVYPEDKDLILQYWTNPLDPANNRSVLVNLSLVLIQNIFNVKRFVANSPQFFQLIARLTSLGTQMREFFLKAKLIGRLMEFLYDDVSPHKELFRDISDINPLILEKPDIGLPTEIDRKQLSQFQEMLENKRMRNLSEANPKYKYLIEAVSNCIRSFRNNSDRTPYQIDDIQPWELMPQERDLYIPEGKFLKRVFQEAKKNRSIAYAAKGYVHFCWSDRLAFQSVVEAIQIGLRESDYDDARPYLMLLQHLLQTPGGEPAENRFDNLMLVFIEVLRINQQYYKFMEAMFDFLFKIASRISTVKEWLMKFKPRWAFLNDWAIDMKFPLNQMDATNQLRIFKRRNNMQIHQQQIKNEYFKNISIREARQKRMEQLMKGESPDLSTEIDIDLVDLQDFKFVAGEVIEFYYKKMEKDSPVQVEQVLDELIQVKHINPPVNQIDGGYNQSPQIQWIGKDTDKLLFKGTFQSQYRQEQTQGNTVMRGQNMRHDDGDGMNENTPNYQDSDEEDPESDNENIYN
ncbi:UNKNOWN [Stylonychia lemnae]|uniref:USP domain-containing protein n=1 Tax=Stylonychia lemnae TaxID=5949 RepID=A0A078A933_STYLE|nr:UNKNOWN [Stylonychia lemnae]|eukprot:CDW78729.1 UNKNOWN [Stylonychia lemnae]